VFASTSVVIAMLADGAALDDVTGRGSPAFARNLRGRVLVQMGTTAPAWSAALEEDVRAVGGRYVEAPVSGSRKPAEAGQLVGMLAGDPDTVAEVRPLLEPMLQRSVVCGAVPDALRMKLAANIFLITQVTGLAESFHFAERHGLDLAVLREVLDSGQMASAISRIKLGMLLAGDFPPQAAVRDVHYNSELIVAAARELGIASPLLDASNALFAEAERQGHGEEDMAAVVRALDASTPVPRCGATG
jgi:3-hydroxyisobutyrate dehydrogenase